MKVKDLLVLLQQENPEATVLVWDQEDGYMSAGVVGRGIFYTLMQDYFDDGWQWKTWRKDQIIHLNTSNSLSVPAVCIFGKFKK